MAVIRHSGATARAACKVSRPMMPQPRMRILSPAAGRRRRAAGPTAGPPCTNNSDGSEAPTPHSRLRTRTQRGPGRLGSGRSATCVELRGLQTTLGQALPRAFTSSILGRTLSTKIARMVYCLAGRDGHRLAHRLIGFKNEYSRISVRLLAMRMDV